jgi:hypothetical protein
MTGKPNLSAAPRVLRYNGHNVMPIKSPWPYHCLNWKVSPAFQGSPGAGESWLMAAMILFLR